MTMSPVPAQFAALSAQADEASKMTDPEVRAKYPTAFQPLGYDPLSAEYFDKIQASALALTEGERTTLRTNGFVVSTSREFATFVRGYAEIYLEHLPVYISADAILETVHSSYDDLLATMEVSLLMPELRALLEGMRTRLSASAAPASVRKDVDVYLAVALSLLNGAQVAPVAGGASTDIQSLYQSASGGQGAGAALLFGKSRKEDYSQFTPRGHYTDSEELKLYFRAMMWLGRVDFRLVESDSNGAQVFNRAQYDAMLETRALLEADMPRWRRMEDVLATFVGKSDNMIPPEVDRFIADIGGPDSARSATDAAVVQTLSAGGYGRQEIASYLMVNDGTVKTVPLNSSFLIFGQRYTIDSHVFSAAVYDRIGGRMMPNPLDAAFSALGNNQAYSLNPDIAVYGELPGALARTRVLVDSKGADFWESSFYNLWMSALRGLSPAPTPPAGLPSVARTDAWGRRILNAQLGSWAELRHDTILYAKQSYTGIGVCDFPDAYVDPYPEVFGALKKYAEQGVRIADFAESVNAALGARVTTYFETLLNAASIFEDVAKRELEGKPITPEQLAYINDAVRVDHRSEGCTTTLLPNGWLAKLYFNLPKSVAFDPTIADVHTQPADEGGTTVGKVLHVGTGFPRYLVATIDSCGGRPRSYAGVVFAYHEEITKDFKRLTDPEWMQRFYTPGQRPANVPWLSGVLGPQ